MDKAIEYKKRLRRFIQTLQEEVISIDLAAGLVLVWLIKLIKVWLKIAVLSVSEGLWLSLGVGFGFWLWQNQTKLFTWLIRQTGVKQYTTPLPNQSLIFLFIWLGLYLFSWATYTNRFGAGILLGFSLPFIRHGLTLIKSNSYPRGFFLFLTHPPKPLTIKFLIKTWLGLMILTSLAII